LPTRGTVFIWRDAAGAPVVELLSLRQEQHARGRSAALGVLLVLVVLLVLSAWPRLASTLARFWPEQLVLVALAGTVLWGPSLVGGALALAGALMRLALVAAWIRRRRPQVVVATNSVGSSAKP
jgi:hypothetical protein